MSKCMCETCLKTDIESILEDFNRFINVVDDAYLWRELSGIDLRLRDLIKE